MDHRKAMLTIFLVVFIDLMGFGLILPLLPYIAEQFQANAFQIGLLTATYSLFQFISAPILGSLSDRYGRKKILIVSQLGTMVGFIMLGLAGSMPLLFLSRLIDGITGGNISIAQAYMADITDNKNRAQGMGMLGAAFGLGFILGPAIGGFLSVYGFWAPAFFAAGLALLSMITTGMFLKETVDTKKVQKAQAKTGDTLIKVFQAHPIGLFVPVFLLMSIGFSGMQSTFALWTLDTFGLGPRENGYIFAFVGIISVVVQLKVLPWVVKKWGERKVLKMSVPILAVGFFIMPLSFHLAMVFLAIAFMVVGNALANPTIQSIASENVAPQEYGGVLGILHSMASLGRILGPVMAGWIYNTWGKDAPYWVSGVFILLAAWLVLKYLDLTKSFMGRIGDWMAGRFT